MMKNTKVIFTTATADTINQAIVTLGSIKRQGEVDGKDWDLLLFVDDVSIIPTSYSTAMGLQVIGTNGDLLLTAFDYINTITSYERAIYVKNTCVVTQDIEPILNLDLCGHAIGGALDWYGYVPQIEDADPRIKWHNCPLFNGLFFNGGVLVFNPKELAELVPSFSALPDDVFNDTFGETNEMMNVAIEEFYVLPQRFNVFADVYDTMPGGHKAFMEIEPLVINYDCPENPWFGYDPELKRIFKQQRTDVYLAAMQMVNLFVSPKFVDKVKANCA